ncbi:MAG: hypothetical protein JOY68_03665 [Candidatus Dormibacteraeota bacterium]|nr:hypothetical protein [Candidatus Dormibacteraeota bacterium]
MPEESPPAPEGGEAEADRLIARAVESVLQAVPEIPGGEVVAVETAPNVQPWAETAEPPGRNKRSLEDFIGELESRVASRPDLRARAPAEPHPGDAYLASLAPGAAPSKRSGKRRWRGRGRKRGGAPRGGG